MTKRILGIDPGSGRMGHALVETSADKPKLIHCGCIETTVNAPEPRKLCQIYEELTKLVQTIKPDIMAVEMLFFANNAKTAFSVGQARGVVLLVSAQANVELAEIAPLALKKTLMGNGSVKKKDVQNFIKEYFHLEKVPKPDDAADAVAIALCEAMIGVR